MKAPQMKTLLHQKHPLKVLWMLRKIKLLVDQKIFPMAKKKAALITPPSVTQLAIGIDIGGTGTKFGIVDRDGNVLFSAEMSTKKHKTVNTFIDELHQVVSEVIDKAGGVGRIKGIGVGAP